MIKKYNTFINESDHSVIDPYNEENWSDKPEDNTLLINDIKEEIAKYECGFITMQDLQADSSPVYKEDESGIHLIERLLRNDVEVIVYGGYKNQDEVDEYQLNYEELDKDTLEEILELLNDAIENDLLEDN